MIVKFSAWNHRTAVYRRRKKTKDHNVVLLDLIAKRAKLLGFAREAVKSNKNIDFSFADINCRIELKMAEGNFKFFRNEDDLKTILNGMA